MTVSNDILDLRNSIYTTYTSHIRQHPGSPHWTFWGMTGEVARKIRSELSIWDAAHIHVVVREEIRRP